MADLTTDYLGLTLKNPLVVSASPLSETVENIQKMAEAGAGAIVLYSLFEEQIEAQGRGEESRDDTAELPQALARLATATGYERGANGYLAHLYQAKHTVDIPIIGSLNGYYNSGWVQYARLMEAAGADAIELNVYFLPTRPQVTGVEVEQMYVDLVENVKRNVSVPVAVKVSPYFTAMANVAQKLALSGADGLVLFNRFYQPDVDPDTRTVQPRVSLSERDSDTLRLRLRWTAVLSSFLTTDIAITGGVHTGRDVAKAILVGAKAAMMTSALLRHGIDHLQTVREELIAWMEANQVATVKAIQGKMKHAQVADTTAYERANYLKTLASYQPSSDA